MKQVDPKLLGSGGPTDGFIQGLLDVATCQPATTFIQHWEIFKNSSQKFLPGQKDFLEFALREEVIRAFKETFMKPYEESQREFLILASMQQIACKRQDPSSAEARLRDQWGEDYAENCPKILRHFVESVDK